jgi:S-adenosylmethionine decarboxylase
LGLHRIIEIAREYCGLRTVWRCFYSRKSFFFPERQQGVHRDWRDEVGFLDTVFGTFFFLSFLPLPIPPLLPYLPLL